MPQPNILVVDDDDSIRLTITHILQKQQYHVTTCAHPLEALHMIQAGPFDLALLDIKMPDMDGVTLLSEIRKVYAEMPVFLLTAHGALCTAIEAIRNGANDYILKPVNPVDLLHRIEAVMQKVGKQKRRQEIELRLDCLIQELQRIDAPQQKSANASHLVEGSAHENQQFLERGNLRIYPANRKAFLEGNELDLPPSAFDYLVCLARRAPQPVSYEDLTLEVQGYRLGRNEARQIARWQIYQLRQAIEPDPDQPQYVLNQRGFGYRLANLG